MSNSDAIEVEGLVLEILGGGKYRVQLVDMDMEVEAYAAGKMKRFRIKIIPGDLVTVELNTYEPTKGRIVYRTINKGSKGNKGKKKNEKKKETGEEKDNSHEKAAANSTQDVENSESVGDTTGN